MAEKTKRKRFDFEAMKALATSDDRAKRKQVFIEYFEEFHEFPSYLFDNERVIDAKLLETMKDLLNDTETSKEMKKGIDELLMRLPS